MQCHAVQCHAVQCNPVTGGWEVSKDPAAETRGQPFMSALQWTAMHRLYHTVHVRTAVHCNAQISLHCSHLNHCSSIGNVLNCTAIYCKTLNTSHYTVVHYPSLQALHWVEGKCIIPNCNNLPKEIQHYTEEQWIEVISKVVKFYSETIHCSMFSKCEYW